MEITRRDDPTVSDRARRIHNDLPALSVFIAAAVVTGFAATTGHVGWGGVLILLLASGISALDALRPRASLRRAEASIRPTDLALPLVGLATAVAVDLILLNVSNPANADDKLALAGAVGFILIMTSRLLCSRVDNRALLRIVSTRAEALGGSEERFRELIINSSDIITVLDKDSVVQYITPAVTRLLGLSEKEMIGKPLVNFLHPEDRQRFGRMMVETAAQDSAPTGFIFRIRDRHLSWRTLEATPTNLLEHPHVHGIVLNTRDITERQALEDELRHQAFHDPLTNLANRALLHDRLEQAVKRFSRNGDAMALVLVDLDDFKTINDSLGHAEGDELLRQAANRMLKCLRTSDTAARLGGDEFAILLEGHGQDLPTLEIAQRLLRGLEQPIALSSRSVTIRASLGIAAGEANLNATDLLRRADVAMYRAKSLGKARCVVFDASMEQFAHEKLQFQSELETALDKREFFMQYQPVVDLESGRIDGVEALIRWQHPTRGMLTPEDFIPAVEGSALIIPISQFVLREACSQGRRWELLFPHRELEVSVNISAAHLQSASFVDDVLSVVHSSRIKPERLLLELTETAVLADVTSSVAKLDRIKQLGVRVALDDFGTGYSSLGYLRELPIDVVKIDRSFLAHVGEQQEHTELVRAIQALSTSLELNTTAEGVENRAQLGVLRALHVDHAQGFLFSRPVDPVEIEKLLDGPAFDVTDTEGFAKLASKAAG